MKSSTFITQVSCFLQLVYVTAGSDVVTFNQEILDEDNIDAALETEHFIHVVDRHNNKPPHNIVVKPPNVDHNISPDVSLQGSATREPRNPAHTQTRSYPSNVSLNKTSRTPSEEWTVSWEVLSKADNNEDDLLDMEELYIPNRDHVSLSRHKRAPMTSGDELTRGQFQLAETGRVKRASSMDEKAIAMALTKYLKEYFGGERIEALVTNIKGNTVDFDIFYDDGEIVYLDIARALNALDKTDNFRVGSITYAVSKTKLMDSVTKVLKAVICFLCSSYQQCKQGLNLNFLCKLLDTRLFPFGSEESDRAVAPNQEFITARVKLQYPIPFDNELVDTLFISPNGVISFGEEFASYSPVPCPVYNSQRRKRKILAPYWADMDVRSGDLGEVFYQVYTKNAGSRENDLKVLRNASRDVMFYSNERQFEATMAIKVTWSDMPASPVRRRDNERVTFQAMIVSNGETSYVIYIYAQGAMRFNPYFSRRVQVCVNGINLDTSRNNFYQFDRVIGNTGNVGHWIYKLGYVPNYAAKCYQWFESYVPILYGIYSWNQIVPACPCSESAAWWSFQWIPSYEQSRCYDSFPQFGQIGRRCCYTRWGSFENRMPLSGNLQMFTPYHYFSGASHVLQDTAPKEWCCYRSNLCHLYYTARPVRSCQPRFTWRGFFYGDPHFSTLDQQKIIFNGLGEYRLLEVNTIVNNSTRDFRIQGRTCRAKGSDGKLTNATIFCAMALLNTNKTTAQVSIDPSDKYMIIFINDQDFTVRFRNSTNYNTSVGDIYIQKMNESLVISTPDNIGITITLVDSLLDFTVEIGVEYRNTTKGLLGNFNGDPSDDLIYPNGTILPNTTSERRIFEYCQTWTVKDSIFTYAPGENSSTFSDPSFVPIFLDEADATAIAEAKKICGGSSNLACKYDYIATRNEQLAMNTRGAGETYNKEEKILSNRPPVISGVNQLYVIVNQSSSLTLTGSDPDDTFYFVIVDSPSSGKFVSTNSSNNLTISYTPFNMDNVSIAVAAVDNQEQTSEITQILIIACSGCSSQGDCDFGNTKNTSDPYFSIASCKCNSGYSGDDCEEDEDGCSIDPCPEGIICTDVPASELAQRNASFICGSCPAGYYLDTDSYKCQDIDECSSTSDICANANCSNTFGSYVCICFDGFRLTDGKCVDINECVENQHHCKHICKNTEPGFTCDCYEGFKISSLDNNCTKLDIDPCENITHLNCSTGCRNNSGNAECFCEIGYRLNADNYTCEDIDECKENLCSQDCTNNNGSYICSCFPGYKLSEDKLSCTFCPDDKYGQDCARDCNCRGHATKCDHVKGCICTEAWSGPNCEVDVNECETLVNPCAKDKICSNLNGSYTCDCPSGYQDINGSCTNVDECLDPSLHKCMGNCIDNPGSFMCVCDPGYNAVDNFCFDIDECALGISECNQKCRNMEGSYNCECHPGFVLDADRKTCVRAKYPCQDFNVSCSDACDIVDGLPQCFCQIGFMLGKDNLTCIDINECTSGLHNCMNDCTNTEGSYNCSCSAGEKLANDRRSCKACDAYHWGPNCGNVCGCNSVGTQICHPTEGCKCKKGWHGPKCSIDKDECSGNVSVCPDVSTCTNTPGSYVCQCKSGFQLNNTACTDINECDKNLCDHNCINTVGSYTCSCKKGFYANGDKCVDIDECALPQVSKCDQRCRNTLGGFACECYQGYILNTTTRNTCYRDPSAQNCGQAKNCSYGCAFEDGQEKCFCLPGFQLDADNSTCKDIDECLNNPCVNGTCNNLTGSFVCVCDDGEKLAEDERTCQECEFWLYGKDCNSSCSCDMANTAECLQSNGTCVCSDGWNGTICTDDIDECDDSSMNVCVVNAHCENTPGSYKCVCDIGYFRASDGECVPCDDTNYGQDCLNICSCSATNTQECDNINGTCTCMPGWTGPNCDVDVDECTRNASYCGPLELCHNLNGSVECLCKSGYYRPNPSDPCRDINECLTVGFQNCTDPRECNNTVGAFECICKKGYLEINGTCQDIDECLNSTLHTCDTNSTECKNTVGGFQCVCKEGFYKDSTGQCSVGKDFPVQITFLYNDSQILTFGDIFNNTSEDFQNLAKLVEAALLAYGRSLNITALLAVRITEFRRGSIVADTHIYINEKNSKNPPGDAATIIQSLYRSKSVQINGTTVPLGDLKIGNSLVTDSLCDTFNKSGGNCSAPGIQCEGEFAACGSKGDLEGNKGNKGNRDKLIIGLAVGIPLFIIFTIAVALLACLYVKRKRTEQEDSSSQSVDHASQFRNVVATRTSTKGSWGAPHQMYAPDNFSDTGTNESGNGGLMKTRQKGRSDFQDSAWYDNRGAMSSGLPDSREASTETGAPVSNFSWEYMFRLLEPHKDFEIQRPFYEPEPNPTFTPQNK